MDGWMDGWMELNSVHDGDGIHLVYSLKVQMNVGITDVPVNRIFTFLQKTF